MGLIGGHISEEEWGMADYSLYNSLKESAGELTVSYDIGQTITLKELIGNNFYKKITSYYIPQKYNIYAITYEDADKISKGIIAGEDAVRHDLDEEITLTSDMGFCLCFEPLLGMNYWYYGEELKAGASTIVLAGETGEMEYNTSSSYVGDKVVFRTFTVDDTTDAAVLKGLKEGADSTTLSAELSETPGQINIRGVKEGLACIMAVPENILNEYLDAKKPLSDSEFMKKAECLFISVKDGRTYTIDGNKGRFIKRELFNRYECGIYNDFADVYSKGEKTITINAPKNCVWNELLTMFYRELNRNGYISPGGNNGPFRYGYRIDYNHYFLTHSGDAGESDDNGKSISNSTVPADIEKVYVAYTANSDYKIWFNKNGGTVLWPDGAPVEDDGDKWYYNAPEYSRFIFPDATRAGYVFKGWDRGLGDNLIPAGSTGATFYDRVFYDAVFEKIIDKLEFTGDIPDKITAGDNAYSYYPSFNYIGEDTSIINVNMEGFRESTELNEDGWPESDWVDKFATDEGHVYYLMIRIGYDGAEEFYNAHPSIKPGVTEGYRMDGYGTVSSYSSAKEAEADAEYLEDMAVTGDMTLYIRWKKELDCITLNAVNVPKCGKTADSYAYANDFGVELQDGIKGSSYCWMNGHMEELDFDDKFTGGNNVILHLKVGIDEKSGALFDRYITENVKLRYNGEEYSGVNYVPGKNGDDTIEFHITVTVEHNYDGEHGLVSRINEVEAGCETEGSYDEVRSYHCDGCDTDVEETIHRTIAPLGHNLVRHQMPGTNSNAEYSAY